MPIDSAIPRPPVTVGIVRVSLGAALGGLLFGFDIAVISGAVEGLQSHFAMDTMLLGITVSSALFATAVGSMVSGPPVDRFGRKAIMVAVALAYLVSSLGTALAQSWGILLVARILGGVAIGASSVVTPIYIAEVAPPALRGRLVACNQMFIVIGILLAFLSNLAIAQYWTVDIAWRWMFGVVAIPSAVYLAVAWVLPESPRWQFLRGNAAGAAETLRRLGMEGASQSLVIGRSQDRR